MKPLRHYLPDPAYVPAIIMLCVTLAAVVRQEWATAAISALACFLALMSGARSARP